MNELRLEIPDELVERIAQLAAELVAQRQNGNSAGWLRGGQEIADYIGAPASRVYSLASCNPPRIPIRRDGSALVARRDELDRWLEAGGGLRP